MSTKPNIFLIIILVTSLFIIATESKGGSGRGGGGRTGGHSGIGDHSDGSHGGGGLSSRVGKSSGSSYGDGWFKSGRSNSQVYGGWEFSSYNRNVSLPEILVVGGMILFIAWYTYSMCTMKPIKNGNTQSAGRDKAIVGSKNIPSNAFEIKPKPSLIPPPVHPTTPTIPNEILIPIPPPPDFDDRLKRKEVRFYSRV